MLKDGNFLNYDTLIPLEILEKIYGKKRSDVKPEQWAFFELTIREIIKEKGFFVTSRKQGKNLYILPENEMAGYSEKKLKVDYKNIVQRHEALCRIEKSNLKENEQRKLEHEKLKMGNAIIQLHTQVYSRCRY
jgi:hypothetical protein